MSQSARSAFVFGLYLVLLGLTLMVMPNTFLGLFGLPAATDVWIRVVGMLTLLLGFYYTQTARRGLTDFFGLTVIARSAVLVFFTAFVLLQFASPILILFGLVDALGALWTWLSLRAEGRGL